MKPPRLEWKQHYPGYWSCGRLRISLTQKTYSVYWINEDGAPHEGSQFIMSGDSVKRFRSIEKAKIAAERVGFLK